MKKRKWLIAFAVGFLLVSVLSSSGNTGFLSHAEVTSGNLGENASYTYDSESCVLTVSGNGATAGYSAFSASPFYAAIRNEAERVVIREGITEIGNYTFYNFTKLKEISFPDGLEKLGLRNFKDCPVLEEVSFPASFRVFSQECFHNCKTLRDVFLTGDPEAAITVSTGGNGVFGMVEYTLHLPCSTEKWMESVVNKFAGTKTVAHDIHEFVDGVCRHCGEEEALPSASETETESESESGSETETESESESGSETETESESESGSETETESESESGSETETESESESGSETETESESESGSDPGSTGLSGNCGEQASWTYENGILTIRGSGKTEMFARTSATDTVNYPWAAVKNEIIEVIVEEGITAIQNYAFYNFPSLRSVTLPASCTELAYGVLMKTPALTNLVVPAAVQTIGSYAFASSGLQTVTFLGSLPRNGTANMFHGDRVTILVPCDDASWETANLNYFSGTVTKVPNHSFRNGVCLICGQRSGEEPPKQGAAGESAYWKIENGILTIYGTGEMTKFTRNSETDAVNYPWAPYKNEITGAVVSTGITKINNYAFYNLKNLRSATIPASVTEIAYGAFRGTERLTELTVPKDVQSLGSYAFASSGLQKVYMYCKGNINGMSNIFDGDRLTLYVPCNDATWTGADLSKFGGTVAKVLMHEYENKDGVSRCKICGLTEGAAPAGDREPGANQPKETPDSWTWEIRGRKLVISGEGDLPDYAVHSGTMESRAPWAAFARTVQEIVIEEGVTGVGCGAFSAFKNIHTVSLPESLLKIGYGAFRETEALQSIEIPGNVREIGTYAFYGSGLNEIVYASGKAPENIGKCAFPENLRSEDEDGTGEEKSTGESEEAGERDPDKDKSGRLLPIVLGGAILCLIIAGMIVLIVLLGRKKGGKEE